MKVYTGKQRREFMEQTMVKTFDTVERERERESYNLKNKPSINFYALLKLYARDG